MTISECTCWALDRYDVRVRKPCRCPANVAFGISIEGVPVWLKQPIDLDQARGFYSSGKALAERRTRHAAAIIDSSADDFFGYCSKRWDTAVILRSKTANKSAANFPGQL